MRTKVLLGWKYSGKGVRRAELEMRSTYEQKPESSEVVWRTWRTELDSQALVGVGAK